MIYYCASVWRTPRRHWAGRNRSSEPPSPLYGVLGDLPGTVANLRYVPEMIVAMLADQKGDRIERNNDVEGVCSPWERFRKRMLCSARFIRALPDAMSPGNQTVSGRTV